MQQRSSVLAELGWLAYFAVLFVIMVYLFNFFVVPHHFNDKIAIVLAAFVAGGAMIVTRAAYARRGR